MNSFSQRKGIKPIKNILQIESMDNDLRNSLWNALTHSYWNGVKSDKYRKVTLSHNVEMRHLCATLWQDYFKILVDTLGNNWNDTYKILREYFFNCRWDEVYDFIEFVANNYSDESLNQRFMKDCNNIFEKELSAYRFVGGNITQITNENEIAEIEEALKIPISPFQQHIKRSLELLSDKKKPDYRNSIKESISAVESIGKLIVKNNTATLTDSIETIEKGKKMKMHPALGRAFKELYSYTNKAEGIRHGLSNEPNLDLEDARFMLISCSAFINYLVVKASKAGIKL